MSRPLRIQYPGAWYHVMNRGRRKEDVFLDAEDFQCFVDLLKESVSMWNINITAFCLMSNHYHLLIQTPEGNLARAMRHINGVYTQRFNRKHGNDGQVFRGRYKSILIDGDNYLLALSRYIHRNPIRAGLVQRVGDYPWSSHKGYLSGSVKWSWINKEAVFSLLSRDSATRLTEYRKFVNEEDSEEMVSFYSQKKLPSSMGSLEFIDWVKESFSELLFKGEIPETKKLAPDMEKIKQIVCKAYKIDIHNLGGIRRGKWNEPRDVAIFLARRLRRDSLREIGEAFGIPNYSSVSSIVESMKGKIARNRKLKKEVEQLEKGLNLSQKR